MIFPFIFISYFDDSFFAFMTNSESLINRKKDDADFLSIIFFINALAYSSKY